MSNGAKILLLSFLGTGAFAAAYLFLFLDMSHPEMKFETYGKVIEYGYDRSGWLPQQLPKTSTNIREIHNPETKQVLVSFEIPEVQLGEFIGQLGQASDPSTVCPPAGDILESASFWPDNFLNSLAADSFSLHASEGTMWVIDKIRSQAYYWTCQ